MKCQWLVVGFDRASCLVMEEMKVLEPLKRERERERDRNGGVMVFFFFFFCVICEPREMEGESDEGFLGFFSDGSEQWRELGEKLG